MPPGVRGDYHCTARLSWVESLRKAAAFVHTMHVPSVDQMQYWKWENGVGLKHQPVMASLQLATTRPMWTDGAPSVEPCWICPTWWARQRPPRRRDRAICDRAVGIMGFLPGNHPLLWPNKRVKYDRIYHIYIYISPFTQTYDIA